MALRRRWTSLVWALVLGALICGWLAPEQAAAGRGIGPRDTGPTATATTAPVTGTATTVDSPTVSATASLTPSAISATAPPTATATPSATETTTPTPSATPPLSPSLLTPPLAFEANLGQTDPSVRFLARGPGYTLYLTGADAVFNFVQAQPPLTPGVPLTPTVGPTQTLEDALRLHFVNANTTPQVTGLDPQAGIANYFIGSDPTGWLTNVPTYGQVSYADLYPGISLDYYGNPSQLEYDFQLAAGADPSAIAYTVEGVQGLTLDGQGNLLWQTALGSVEQAAPLAYQVIGGQRVSVSARYTLSGGQVGFALGAYDTSQPLVIDPVLSYSTYLGGSGNDHGYGIAVDALGNVYVTGVTGSVNFPTTTGAYSTTYAGGNGDAFVSKLSARGDALVYSTYLGGSGDDFGNAIAVDGAGNAYVAGSTTSTDFPLVHALPGVNQCCDLNDAFLSKLNPSGTALLYSTYLHGGNEDYGAGVAVDPSGTAYVTGYTLSTDFPVKHAYQPTFTTSGGNEDVFVSALDTNASGTAALLYSTYLGGSYDQNGAGIATDGAGHAFITGYTRSSDFPVKNAYQSSYKSGGADAFVTELDTTASGAASLLYSTYLGGSGDDVGQAIALDRAGNAYVTGYTGSTDFPTQNAFQGSLNRFFNAFVTELNPSGSGLIYSTYLGGSDDDAGYGIAVDGGGHAAVTGVTDSTGFPVANAPQATFGGNYDAFVTRFAPGGRTVDYSTYLGGSGYDQGNAIAVDGSGNAYVTGDTQSTDFPTVNAVQGTYGGGACGVQPCYDAFVARIGASASGTVPWRPHQNISLGAGLNLSVDLADGHADLHSSALRIPARGPDLTLDDTWDSTLAQTGVSTRAGQGWVSSLTPHLSGVLTGTMLYTDSSGAVWPFVYSGSLTATAPYSSYVTPPGLPWQLSTDTTVYTLTNILNGAVLTFHANGGGLKAQSDAYGNANTLGYSGTEATSEANSGGRSLAFSYSGGLLTDAQSPLWQSSGGTQGQHVTYGYVNGNQVQTQTLGAGTSDAVTTTYGYSGTQLVSVTTPYTQATHTWSIGYDGLGRVGSVTSPASGTVGQTGYTPAITTTFAYTAGQTQVVAGAGSSAPLTTTYTLDAQGEPITVTNGLGQSSSASYDTDHDVLRSTDQNGNTTANYYQYVGPNASTGLVTETVAPPIQPDSPLNSSMVSPTTLHYYNATNDLTETVAPGGGATLYGYDGHHGVITTTQLLTGTTVWRGSVNGYDQYGELVSVTDGRGVSVNGSGVATLNAQAGQYTRALSYDAQGDQTAQGTAPITTTLNTVTTANTPVTTTYGFDGDGDLITTTVPNAHDIIDGYDHLGRLTSTSQPKVTLYGGSQTRPLETTRYDGEGNVVRQTDGAGDVTTSSYDPRGRLVAETNPISGTSVYTYNATEQTASQDPAGNVTTDQYDAAGRLITETAPISGVTQYQYDAAGNTTVITQADTSLNPIQVDTRQYDALNRVITETISGPGGPSLTTATRYDQDGNTYQVVRPAGDAVVNTYDLADELLSTEVDTQTVSAATHQTQQTYGYDAAGNQTGATDFNGDATSSLYDGDNRLVQSMAVTGTSTVTTTTGYDPDGNALTTTVQAALAGSPQPAVVDTATYNAADWQTSLTDNGLTTSYGYDAAGRLRTRSTNNGQILDTLDAEGRTTAISATTAGVSTYGYNADDQPVTATLPNNVSGTMTYNPNTQLTGWSYLGPSTGVTTTTVNLAYSYGYDAAERTSAITVTDNGAASVRPLTHDAAGRITSWSGPGGPQTWGYSGDGSIISDTMSIAGVNRTTVFTYSATQPNELVQQHTDLDFALRARETGPPRRFVLPCV